MDAGRFRGIDDIRDMCMKAYYSPIGNKKVYIIDECHALTPEAWTALLKLLEEPPPTIVIMLCTTQPEKILDTIKSRCQIYNFIAPLDCVVGLKLLKICKGIGISPSPEHLEFIASSAQGNMRTAENTLEQIAVLSTA
jgi:DNA polymerase-3 subunit gamma/tau